MLNIRKKLLSSITAPVTLTPREAFLGLSACAFGAAACLMTGMVVGMLISPRKAVTIGSHNGCNNGVCSPEPPEQAVEG